MKHSAAFLLVLLLSQTAAVTSEWKVAGIFTDHMVLQRDRPVPIWGWAEPEEKVTVNFAGQEKQATADAEGKWRAILDAMPASAKPRELKVRGAEEIMFKDVLVGEVWLCSGQSNMAMIVDRAKDPEKEKAAADLPDLRVFAVKRATSLEPLADCEGDWVISSPETAGRFSATAFFFGRELHRELEVPIGLIVAAWSGSAIEAWTSSEAQEKEPALRPLLKSWREKDAAYTPEIAATETAAFKKQFAEWKTAARAAVNAGKPRAKAPRRPVNPREHWHHPTVLFNGMIAPVVSYGIRGAIWYQGETNAFTEESSALYEKQLGLMVNDWRARWGQGDFPMAWVQLPFSSARSVAWARIRESMHRATALPNTGMAITIDLGEERLLHPLNKQAFGHRLALWARANVYGEKIPWTGPLPSTPTFQEGGKVIVPFDHADQGLKTRDGGKVKGFELSNQKGEWHAASAVIKGSAVWVRHPDIIRPAAVRYAWSNQHVGNLISGAELPATPFRLDKDETKPRPETPQAAAVPKKAVTPPPTKPPLDPADVTALPGNTETFEIFLLMGQSNMKGRGVMPEEPLRDPRIIMMHRRTDEWFLARHPLHLVGSPVDFKGADNAGVGSGLAFAETVAKARPKSRIALVPCAVGGTAISKWKKGQRLYEDAIRKAKLALEQGPAGKTRIGGALWLQGESDSNSPEKIAAYPEALAALVDNVRNDLGIPDLPFIACTIGEMRADIEARKKINAILLDLPEQRPNTACVDARDLRGHIGDQVHFDTPTQEEIGRRFTAEFLKMTQE